MNRRTICRILAGVPMVLAMAAAGQSPRVLRVAWVSPERAGSSSPNLAAFRAGMRELGYMEGKNLVIDTSWTHEIPAVSGWALFVQRGNLMSYGPVIDDCYRRLAVYVD